MDYLKRLLACFPLETEHREPELCPKCKPKWLPCELKMGCVFLIDVKEKSRALLLNECDVMCVFSLFVCIVSQLALMVLQVTGGSLDRRRAPFVRSASKRGEVS